MIFCPKNARRHHKNWIQMKNSAKKTHQFKGEWAICALILPLSFWDSLKNKGLRWKLAEERKKSIVYFNLMILLHMRLLFSSFYSTTQEILKDVRKFFHVTVFVNEFDAENLSKRKEKKGKEKKLKHHDKQTPSSSWCFIILDNYHHYWDHIN